MTSSSSTYKKINLIFAGVFACIFIYSGIFAYTGLSHPLPSSHKLLTGQDSISTGLSRSFSEIMKLDLQAADNQNPHGRRVFAFFLIQLILRVFLAFTKTINYFELRKVVIIDCIISAALFILFFKPFILDFFRL